MPRATVARPLRATLPLRGARTAKTVLATVAAYLAALAVPHAAIPIVAPLTALLVVQVTLYDSLTSGLQRVVAVVVGVLVAIGFGQLLSLTWWSLGLIVGAGVLIGRGLRLGDAALEVPISGMLILAVGAGSRDVALDRVVETLIGAVVGVTVHALVAPPLYVRPTGDAVQALADRIGDVLQMASDGVDGAYTAADAERWLDDARRLPAEVARADRAVRTAEAALRANPRRLTPLLLPPGRAPRGRADLALRRGLDSLEHMAVSLRGVLRALADRATGTEEEVYGDDVRQSLCLVLHHLAAAVRAYGQVLAGEVDPRTGGLRVAGGVPVEPAGQAELADLVRQAVEERHRLSGRLRAQERPNAARWELHGALLAELDRLLGELDVPARTAYRDRLAQQSPRPVTALVSERPGLVAIRRRAVARRRDAAARRRSL